MQTSLETLGELERRLTMSVPVAQIESEIAQRLARLAKNAKVPGFRPGKVPIRMVAQQYGPQVRSDVISDAVKATFADAIREQNLRIAGYPRIEPMAEAATPSALEFSAVFEVYPEVRIGELSDITIERPQTDVGPDDVDRTIEMLRKQRTRYERVARAAAPGDRAIVDFSGTIEGVAFPGGHSLRRMLPECEAAVTGMTADGTKTFMLTFPADYHGKEVAGRQATFTLTVKSIEAGHLPEIDADFVKAFGIATGGIDDLKAEIASNLKLELKRKIDTHVKEQVFAALRQKAAFTLPKSLVEIETQNMAQRMAADMRERGMKADDVNLAPEIFRAGAESRVALGLILSEVVRTEGLGAKPDQVKALVQEAAQTYEQPDAVVRWHYEKPERLSDFEALAVEHNVVAWVLGRAQVQDKAASFTDLMGTART
jgi:trigger factor